MDWSLSGLGITSKKAPEAHHAVNGSTVPDPVKNYCRLAIDGLVAVNGPDVLVTITGSGHLCHKKTDLPDTSTATINVSKA